MTDELIAFLRARLDEDERAARAVEPLGYTTDMGGNRLDEIFTHGRLRFASEDGMPRQDKSDKAASEHFARYTPDRALADVAAKRQMVERLTVMLPGSCYCSSSGSEHHDDAEELLKLMGLAFAGHPDYREEQWKP